MNRKITVAGMLTLLVYPAFLVLMFINHLFSNRSFNFFGFGLDLLLMDNGAEIGLFIKPQFFMTFVVIFVVSLGCLKAVEIVKNKERRI